MTSRAHTPTEAFPHISDYTLTEKLYEGARTAVYRALSAAQQPVVIKVMQQAHPDFSELVHFRNQYAITRNSSLPGVVRPLSLEPYQNGYALVMEDFGGCSLQQYTADQSLSLIEILGIALQMADILHDLNQHHVVHKDIKPANILIQPTSKRIQLIDFSIATLLPKETQEITNPNVLEGTLAYLAPEQTGRMNRGIDYRTDFYGLGVTLYELLTGKVPFSATDPLELVHCHIAKMPVAAHEVNTAIPSVISQIVLKLMGKNAEDRYQSSLGLKHDLTRCLHALKETEEATGNIAEFELGQRDVSDRFLIPNKLYGRGSEVQQLLEAFERASQGHAEMMLVAGFSGIGKTAVINEVHKPITRQHGYFIKGKFDQFNRNIPFSAFVQAFRSLMGQLLSESDQELAQWKAKILAAVGDQGQVIIDVIPELECIIGSQPAIAELSGSAAQNRFNLLLNKFVQVFTGKDHPLVIFLDDLQWADSASLSLLKELMSQSESGADSGCLLALGAYRDNEVFPAHPLMLTLDEMRAQGTTLNTLTLEPLGETDLTQLVADTLMCQADIAAPLSQLIAQKTQGNPFFATQFLTGLYEDSYIAFDVALGYWHCDMTQVRQLALTDDVVAFMVGRLQKLPETTQTVLKLAACIGNRFDLATLAIVCEARVEVVAADLWAALREGLIIPITDAYKFFQEREQGEDYSEDVVVGYRFLHDRVQQAAYSLIPEADKKKTHLQIGQLLLSKSKSKNLEEMIFTIVGQLNMGVDLLETEEEKLNLARINLTAGKKAKTSTAYVAAIEYFHTAIDLLPSAPWENYYVLTLDIFVELLESEYLNTNFDIIEELSTRILEQTQTLLDTIKVYEIKIRTWIGQGDQHQALKTGLDVLNLLGISLRETQPEKVIDVAGLVDASQMSDANQLAAMKIMEFIITPAWAVSPEFFQKLTFTMVDLSIKHGNCAASAFAYTWYGTLLCEGLGDIDTGYEFGQLAIALLDHFPADELRSKVLILNATCVGIWKKHVRDFLPAHLSGLKSGLANGEIEYACYGAAEYSQYIFLIGFPLDVVRDESQKQLEIIQHFKQDFHIEYMAPCLQGALNLLGEGRSQRKLDGPVYCEDKRLSTLFEEKQLTLISIIYFVKSFLSYVLGDSLQAVEEGTIALENSAGVAGTLFVPLELFYSSLAKIDCFKQWDSQKVELEKQSVLDCLEKLKHWAQYAPMNYQHKCDLIEAELACYNQQFIQAIELYERAIAGAKKNQYLQDESLGNERAAKFYLSWGKEKIAAVYMQEAYYGYARWGAKTKVDDLEQLYPSLLQPILQPAEQSHQNFNPLDTIATIVAPNFSIHASTQAGRASTTGVNAALDFATVLKASQALSSTIELEDLLRQLTQIILQNSGGDRCALILADSNETWQLKALATPDNTDLCSDPLAGHPQLPLKLIQYVKNTQETIVINNLETELPVIDDYLEKSHPQSLLCLPLLNQSKLLGILYLRNRNTCGAFTQERIHILGFLCTQAAISLENSRLYQQAQTYAQQAQTYAKQLEKSQLQTVQSEKMASLGNLVAGVAHEINNPIGFLNGSVENAQTYLQELSEHLALYQKHHPPTAAPVQENAEDIDLDFLLDDFPKLLNSMTAANERIKSISTSLRTFSRADTEHKVSADLHEGIDSTLLILKYRLKVNENRPAIEVVKDYGELPLIDCFPGQLNQVFMNLLANAIDIFDEAAEHSSFAELEAQPQIITVKTVLCPDRKWVEVRIGDNGKGMPEDVKARIFDHLFTTKGVGKGTGLGLAIAQQIVVEKHGGSLTVQSELGQGTEFCIQLPL